MLFNELKINGTFKFIANPTQAFKKTGKGNCSIFLALLYKYPGMF